jgi:ribose transport system substrate-binding protein
MSNRKSGWLKRSKAMVGVCAAMTLAIVPIAVTAGPAAASSNITIAFAQGYCGNTWRAAMNSAFFYEASLLQKEGQIASYKYVCANDSVPTQQSQIGTLILDHPSVIIIDPNSTTALNGVIAKAHAAGIPVLDTESGPVTSTIPYELNEDNWDNMYLAGQYLAQRMHGAGNILEDRGLPGLTNETVFHYGLLAALKSYPKIHVVASVWGAWDDATTETKVASIISGLPTINAVASQGGVYGALEAIKAAGRPVPLVTGDNRGTFLHWWAAQNKATGYTTESIEVNPGVGAAAAWVAAQIAKGKSVPKTMVMPVLTITQSMLPQFKNTALTTTASQVFPASWYQAHLLAHVATNNGQGPGCTGSKSATSAAGCK